MPIVIVTDDAVTVPAPHDFKRGDNIIYTPPEADDNPKLVLHGQVVSIAAGKVFCRFYFRGTRIWWTPRDSAIPVDAERLAHRKGWKAK